MPVEMMTEVCVAPSAWKQETSQYVDMKIIYSVKSKLSAASRVKNFFFLRFRRWLRKEKRPEREWKKTECEREEETKREE